MQEHLIKGKEVLKILINNGFEAYFIGEIVRSSIMGLECDVVDITTSATPSAIKGIFYTHEIKVASDDTLELSYDDCSFLLHTFVTQQNTPTKILNKHYSKNLLDDLACRDYTINAIAMSHSGKLTDISDGYEDIRKHKIRIIGNGRLRYTNEPILLIKAFSLVSELNFNISYKTKLAIRMKSKLFENISIEQFYPELVKTLNGAYCKKALDMMIKTKFYKHIPSLRRGLKALQRNYHKATFEELLIMSFVLNGGINEKYAEFVDDFAMLKQIYHLAVSNPKAKYDDMILFSNGLDICLESNRINWLIGKSLKKERKIKKKYQALKIKKVCDLTFKGEDIVKMIAPQYEPQIPAIIDEIVLAVLEGRLQNSPKAIEAFTIDLLKKMNIPYDLRRPYVPVQQLHQEERRTNENVPKTLLEQDYTAHRLSMLEQRVNEQDRLIRESGEKLAQFKEASNKEKVEKVVKENIDLINNDKSLQNFVKDKDDFSKKLNEFMTEYLKNEENNRKDDNNEEN